MKRTNKTVRAACIVALVAAALASPGLAADADYDSIADNVVNQSLEIRPGEIVLINGNPAQIELMGALQVAVAKAGGQPVVQLTIPEANKRAVMETPMEHLGRLPTAGLMQLRMADAVINVTSIQDPQLFSDVPEERLAALREAGAPLNDAFRTTAVRTVTLGQTGGIPTAAFSESMGAEHGAMTGMFWQAVDVGSDQLAASGHEVAGMLEPGATVRLTSDAGTDLTFKIDDLPARINAGRTADVVQASGPANVWLPAGEAYACVDAASASGKLVVPHTVFRGKPIENLELTFADGKVTGMSAASGGEMLEKFFDASSAKTRHLSVVDVGLNPHSQPTAKYASWEMGGMVTVGLGNNAWAGGDNNADGAVSFHLTGATLEVGGKPIVAGGKLAHAGM